MAMRKTGRTRSGGGTTSRTGPTSNAGVPQGKRGAEVPTAKAGGRSRSSEDARVQAATAPAAPRVGTRIARAAVTSPPVRMERHGAAVPVRLKALLRTPSRLLGGTHARPEARTALDWQAARDFDNRRLSEATAIELHGDVLSGGAGVRRLRAIRTLDGDPRGRFEPGRTVRIAGRGFGDAAGSVQLLVAGRRIALQVFAWSDTELVLQADARIAGLPDADSVDFRVTRRDGDVIARDRFGFTASREDQRIAPPIAAFEHDRGGSITLPGFGAVDINMAPTELKTVDGFLVVHRYTRHDGGDRSCFADGFDRIRFDRLALASGFQVTGYLFYFDWRGTGEGNPYQVRDRSDQAGRFASDWEDGGLRIDYGVQRFQYDGEKIVFVPITDGFTICNAFYRVQLIVTGPKGVRPLQRP